MHASVPRMELVMGSTRRMSLRNILHNSSLSMCSIHPRLNSLSPEFLVPFARYEVACFLMQRKAAHRIKFVPVQISIIWILTYFAVATTWLTLLLAQRFGYELFTWSELYGKINLGLVVAVQICILYPPLFYLMNQMMYDIAQLPKQLKESGLLLRNLN